MNLSNRRSPTRPLVAESSAHRAAAALTVLLHCTAAALTVLLHCTAAALTVLLHCTAAALTVLLHCTAAALTVLLHCTAAALTVLLHLTVLLQVSSLFVPDNSKELTIAMYSYSQVHPDCYHCC